MVTVCQQCGDRGYYEALIDCVKCQTTSVHLYCLPVLPASFEDDVVWYCEDCEPKVAEPLTGDNPSFVLVGKCDSGNLEIKQASQSNLRLKKNAVNKLSNNKEKRRDFISSLAKAKVQKCGNSSSHHLPVHHYENHDKDPKFRGQRELDGRGAYEEAESVKTKNSLIAGDDCKSNRMYSCKVPCCDSDRPYEKFGKLIVLDGSSSNEEAESFTTRTSHVVTNDPLNIPECSSNAHKESTLEVHCSGNDKKDYQIKKRGVLVRSSSDAESESLKNSPVTTSNPLSIPHSSNVCKKSIIEVQCKENDEKDLRLIRWRVSDGGNSTEEAEPIKNETSLVATSRLSNIPEHSYAPAQPIIEPIWKGSLRLSSDKYGTIEGLVAHLATSACSKVFQEANLLSHLLWPELLPRSNVWPKSFQKWGPSDDDVALYLFPNNEQTEIVYDSLVEDMISKDVALRSVVKNAELLFFTSNLLPCQFRRFQSKFYLWGVFRAKQASQSQALALHSVNVTSLAEPKDHANAVTRYPQSPASPLSDSGSYGSGPSGSVYSCQSIL